MRLSHEQATQRKNLLMLLQGVARDAVKGMHDPVALVETNGWHPDCEQSVQVALAARAALLIEVHKFCKQ